METRQVTHTEFVIVSQNYATLPAWGESIPSELFANENSLKLGDVVETRLRHETLVQNSRGGWNALTAETRIYTAGVYKWNGKKFVPTN